MRVERIDAAPEFLRRTAAFRSSEAVLTNIIGSVAEGVVAGREYESELWLVVLDDNGDVVGCAMRTAPWHLAVSPMDDLAAEAVGRRLASLDPELPGINGPRQVVDAVVRGLAPVRQPCVRMTDIARVLDALTPPGRPASGAARLADRDDLGLLIDWHRDFGDEAGLPVHEVATSVESAVARSGLWIWEDGGRPVAMGGHAPPVSTPSSTIGRIGPVYTPIADRRRGYGSAITIAVANALLASCDVVMLFADAANPDSNSIYERLGFRAVAEIVEVDLT